MTTNTVPANRSTTSAAQKLIWAATGILLAVIASVVMTQAWSVGAAPGDDDATYVPIPSCRAWDTRAGEEPAGGKKTPVGPGETYTQQITGAVGNCTIPNTAVGVAMNITTANGTAQSNLRVFPGDVVTVPTVSNLNWMPGDSPSPNKVDVKLSPAGTIKIYNQNGQVDVIGDIVGYYTSESLQELNQNVELLLKSRSFVETEHVEDLGTNLSDTPQHLGSVTVTAPVDGQVTVSSQAQVSHSGGGAIACGVEVTLTTSSEHLQILQADAFTYGSVSGTRTFDISAGQTVEYVLSCIESSDGGAVLNRTITALFTPAT